MRPVHVMMVGDNGSYSPDDLQAGWVGKEMAFAADDVLLLSDANWTRLVSRSLTIDVANDNNELAAERWQAVAAALRRWRALDDDWNGDGAIAPTYEQLIAAGVFVETAEAATVAEPEPYIASDGEFGFHWSGNRVASVSFLPEGRFLAYCERADADAVRIGGPLDVAAASGQLFRALAAL